MASTESRIKKRERERERMYSKFAPKIYSKSLVNKGELFELLEMCLH